jgi:hypothetical protein
MTGADRVIKWSTSLAVLGVALIAAVVSYEHASALVRAHGEGRWTARLIPLTMDGLIYANSMVMLDSARRGVPVPVLARWLQERAGGHVSEQAVCRLDDLRHDSSARLESMRCT